MPKKEPPKVLLVEGQDDKRVIPELMEANGISWEKDGVGNFPVEIRAYGGYEKLADSDEILSELKSPNLTHFGIIVDADVDINARWQSLRNACLPVIANLPLELPATGLVDTINNKAISQKTIRFGLWIMPNNQTQGMLETFLASLVPQKSDNLWNFAKESAQKARKQGAPFTDVQIDKAYIYTWLAWQKPPGRQLHDAIKQKILDPIHPTGKTLVTWFKNLYDL